MMDCLFCKIASGQINASVVWQDDEILAFEDIQPQAPTHILFIPKRHISTTAHLEGSDAELVGKLAIHAARIARERGFSDDGYRLVLNCNAHGGQTVFHIHLHLLGGRAFSWPPG